MENIFKNPKELVDSLKNEGYVIGERLSVALYLALAKGKPLFLEGEAGVGKTEIDKNPSVNSTKLPWSDFNAMKALTWVSLPMNGIMESS